jgi:hypothetical protein
MRIQRWMGTAALVLGAAVTGCSAEIDESAEAEEVGSVDSALVVGNWSATMSNGSFASPAVTFTQDDGNLVVACEGFEAGDNRWHPGKLWSGQCRYEYGGSVRRANSYRTLKSPSSGWHYQPDVGGLVPSSALASNNPSPLPLCVTWHGFGKVWAGECRVEYQGNVHRYGPGAFSYVLPGPA